MKIQNLQIKKLKKRLIIKEKIKVKLIVLKISYIITNKKYELIKKYFKKINLNSNCLKTTNK